MSAFKSDEIVFSKMPGHQNSKKKNSTFSVLISKITTKKSTINMERDWIPWVYIKFDAGNELIFRMVIDLRA